MSAVGPVCHIAPAVTTTTKVPTNIPAVPPPAQATIQSLQNTVNTLRQIIIIITGQQADNGQGGQGSSGGSITSPAPPGGSYVQKSVTMQTQRVYQNNDPSTGNFVDVQYVSNLVMGNTSTKSTWTYNAPPPTS